MILSLLGKPFDSEQMTIFSSPFQKADIEEMLGKVKNKLDEERKKAQVEILVDQGHSTELEEAIHSRLADSQLTLKDLAPQLGFSPLIWVF